MESNFLINEMLHSGRVIFGDPVTTYLNNIKAEILKANPELDDDIRIYTLLSNDVNAFTADNGIVLVTTGLVAQAQNEAEIAFILCHEFSHFYKKHAIDNYVENRKIERGIGVYSSLDNDAVDLEKFKYSKFCFYDSTWVLSCRRDWAARCGSRTTSTPRRSARSTCSRRIRRTRWPTSTSARVLKCWCLSRVRQVRGKLPICYGSF